MGAFVTGGSGFVGRRLLASLHDRGETVRGLARSAAAAAAVEQAGAEAVRGDLSDVDAMAAGMEGCGVVYHLAATVDQWGDRETFERVNVQGTANAVTAARQAGVDRFVHASTEAVLADGSPLRDVDETRAIPADHVGHYPRTKAAAEQLVRAADGDDLTTVAVRPRFVWGAGDTNLLPGLIDAVEAGQFAWFDGGDYRTSTCHVANVVEGFLCAADAGEGGAAYFVTDGEPVEFRSFVTDLLATQGVSPPDRSVPTWLARRAATAAEFAWRQLPLSGAPPLTRMAVATLGQEMTVDDSLARRDIGYEGRTTRSAGLAELHDAAD